MRQGLNFYPLYPNEEGRLELVVSIEEASVYVLSGYSEIKRSGMRGFFFFKRANQDVVPRDVFIALIYPIYSKKNEDVGHPF